MINDDKNIGDIKLTWSIPEFNDYTRNKKWYIVAGVVALLLLIYAIFTANLLFGFIIVIAAITLVKLDKTKPKEIDFAITGQGILIGEAFYEYDMVNSFYIIYELPKVNNLFIEFKSFVRPRVNIPLIDQDPQKVRDLLKNYTLEDLEKKGEPISETIGKILKL